jgi:hypothetical protein
MSQEQPLLVALQFQVKMLEHDMQSIQAQLGSYVPKSINDLNLKAILETLQRMGHEIAEIRTQLKEMKETMDTRDREQRESQDKLQIRAMWGAIAFGLSVIGGVLVIYFGHFS